MDEVADSTDWHEEIPNGEHQLFEACARKINQYQLKFARNGDGQPHRGFHVKSHVGLSATFKVMADLPSTARHGVFRSPRSFAAWVRITNGFSAAQADWMPDLVGLAVKLHNLEGDQPIAGEAVADTQDFLALNQPYVPADDAVELMIMSTAAANPLSAPFKLLGALGLRKSMRILMWFLAWLPRRIFLQSVTTEHFYGLTPITIGPHAVKYQWRAQQTPKRPSLRLFRRNRLREDLRERLRKNDLVFDFLVQFYQNPSKTPIDGSYAWDAPLVKLGELAIVARDLESVGVKQDENYLQTVAFTPWHALPEHRPIGNIQRGRRVIYAASARYSGRRTDAATPD